MGQRSQIYVRYQDNEGKNYLIARYYSWNFAERMISRCRYTLEWIEGYIEYPYYFMKDTEKLERIMDTNFDMIDVVIGQDIVKEYFEQFADEEDFNDMVFKLQDNNDGKLFIDVRSDGTMKYAFTNTECNTDNIMDAYHYMKWNKPNWMESEYIEPDQKELCFKNLGKIPELAQLMTKEELEDFISAEYVC